ncbi:MAG: DNA internalization-related competence protein ComEC/Rec2 [Methylotenera sp.]
MIFIVLGVVSGAWMLQQQTSLPSVLFSAISLMVLAAIALSLLVSQEKYSRKPLLTIVALLLASGLFGYHYAGLMAEIRLSDELPPSWEQKNIEVIGTVASMTRVQEQGEQFRFYVEQILTPDAVVPKHILLNYFNGNQWNPKAKIIEVNAREKPPIFKVGERWQLTIRLKRPHATYNPNGYDYEAWALANNIRAMGVVRNKSGMQKKADFVWRPAYIVEYSRNKIAQHITRTLSGKSYAGVIRALVVGDDSKISKLDWDIYLYTGVNHLMSISGLHITMLAGLAFSVISFIWRRYSRLVMYMPTKKAATIGGALVALLYACLAGLSIPTQRTLYMLTVVAVALLLNQRINFSRVLLIALLVVVLIDPWSVNAPGFWLSFSAVAIITFATVNRLRLRHWFIEAVNTQWSVTVGLLPFLIFMFGQASIVSPLANAFAIPIISLLVVPLSILGALIPLDFILQLAHSILSICMLGLNWLASLPFATWQQPVVPFWRVAIGMVGVIWLLLPRGIPLRWLGFILMLPMILTEQKQLNIGEMQITVLDVGQGLSVVVKTANHTMLYDTGRQYNQDSDAGASIVLPYLRSQGIKEIDALIISHDDNDHSGGFASIMAKLPVVWTASSYTLPSNIIFAQTQSEPPKQSTCFAGQKWLWDGVLFEVLYPSIQSYQHDNIKDNNRSCVIKVTSRNGTILLTGDIEEEAETLLLQTQRYKIKSDVMIAPHHGSKTSSTELFIQSVGAKHIIFTVGYLNRFRHPRPSVMGRYLQNGAQLYRSDYHGAVLIDFIKNQPIQPRSWRLDQAKYWHNKYL